MVLSPSSISAFAHTRLLSYAVCLASLLASSVASRRSLVSAEVRDLRCLALLCLLVIATKERGREFAAGCGVSWGGVGENGGYFSLTENSGFLCRKMAF